MAEGISTSARQSSHLTEKSHESAMAEQKVNLDYGPMLQTQTQSVSTIQAYNIPIYLDLHRLCTQLLTNRDLRTVVTRFLLLMHLIQ